LLYNITSVCAAFAGVISPLIAAIIMPVSSLTVLFSTLYGTKKLRHLWRS
jgi:cation transport ATPase